MLLKKMIAVCACAAAALSAAAGTLSPRAGLWENALECRAEKRPKDAAAALGEIAAQCAAENAWSEYALAVEMRADAEAAPAGGNAPIERVRALSAALADAPSDAARIFLEARLARAFAALADAPRPGTLRGNGDAERGNEAPEDIAAWSDAQLRAEAERRFENVLAQATPKNSSSNAPRRSIRASSASGKRCPKTSPFSPTPGRSPTAFPRKAPTGTPFCARFRFCVPARFSTPPTRTNPRSRASASTASRPRFPSSEIRRGNRRTPAKPR